MTNLIGMEQVGMVSLQETKCYEFGAGNCFLL